MNGIAICGIGFFFIAFVSALISFLFENPIGQIVAIIFMLLTILCYYGSAED